MLLFLDAIHYKLSKNVFLLLALLYTAGACFIRVILVLTVQCTWYMKLYVSKQTAEGHFL